MVSEIYQLFKNKESTINNVVLGCQDIESKLRFNVGIRSKFIFDRLVHITVWLMDRTKQIFSGIIKVSSLKISFN
ncbi:isoaspartyl peptidase/L-asparaginase [cyanobacterium endosymbiont of Epithemia turgida]|uniref:isoaspartyl peptidase/L-asparaginase n=1 Tax=cyanobacterium endosymbiont of Epithemia turgida TaxID=718217 RepID=UPI0011AE848B